MSFVNSAEANTSVLALVFAPGSLMPQRIATVRRKEDLRHMKTIGIDRPFIVFVNRSAAMS